MQNVRRLGIEREQSLRFLELLRGGDRRGLAGEAGMPGGGFRIIE